MSRARRGQVPREILQNLHIESIDLDANGVAHADGKVVFVRGALPEERVDAERVRSKPRYDVAQMTQLRRRSALRVEPRCPHFGVCGGCSMQHLEASAQFAIKQRALEDQLWHLARLRPRQVLAPLIGPVWGYRYRARLSVRNVPKKGGVLVGFHERGSSYVADMSECHVMPPLVSSLLVPLRELVASLSLRERLPQIEVAVGDPKLGPGLVLVLRVLEPPTADDLAHLAAFAARHRVELWQQPKGPDSAVPLFRDDGTRASDESTALAYALPEFDLHMPYRPTDFTQVNHQMNEALVGRALRLLEPAAGERVLDLFCGLGNFTLPIARRGAQVLGMEGNERLLERARANAAANGLADRVQFAASNLFEIDETAWSALGRFDRLLIDPPREGALTVSRHLAATPVDQRPRRIVYVSCNPATLARDAAVLVHEGGWVLQAAGAVNMFPHTSHVESVAVLAPG